MSERPVLLTSVTHMLMAIGSQQPDIRLIMNGRFAMPPCNWSGSCEITLFVKIAHFWGIPTNEEKIFYK